METESAGVFPQRKHNRLLAGLANIDLGSHQSLLKGFGLIQHVAQWVHEFGIAEGTVAGVHIARLRGAFAITAYTTFSVALEI